MAFEMTEIVAHSDGLRTVYYHAGVRISRALWVAIQGDHETSMKGEITERDQTWTTYKIGRRTRDAMMRPIAE